MQDNLAGLIDRLQRKKMMIIGDMVADVYLEGKISRISREAPVLILENAGETVVPGGAANAVHNAATLGGEVYAVGLIGDDSAGRELTAILAAKKVITDGFIIDPARPTITKTRVMAGGQATVRQQVVRIDKESKQPLSPAVEQRLIRYIEANVKNMDVVVISDYGGQTLSANIRAKVIEACNAAGIPSIVDSRYNILAFPHVTAVKQNEAEAAGALGLPAVDSPEAVEAAGKALLDRMAAQVVLITRGPEGMSLFERGGRVHHIPVTNKSEVYDVTGAGDTVVVTMMLAVAAGASYPEAAALANFAAGVVVRKPGTATATPWELKQAIGVHYENR